MSHPFHPAVWPDTLNDGTGRLRPGRRQQFVMYGVDIVGFGPREALHDQLRRALYGLVEEAAEEAGISVTRSHVEDRGDAVFVTAPLDSDPEDVLGVFIAYLHAGLRRYNRAASREARLRLRMAVAAGYVKYDGHGV